MATLEKRGKSYRKVVEGLVRPDAGDVVSASGAKTAPAPTVFTMEEAFAAVVGTKRAKFDETVDVAIRLGVDPKHSDQMVRGAVSLPNGTGKTVRVLCFAKGDAAEDATQNGADFVGAEDLVEKIEKENWLDFDRVVATPDMMRIVSRVGKLLGPRGLMPNPKTGSVTPEVGKAVAAAKAGQIEYRVEKAGIVHAVIGKASFTADALRENFMALVQSLVKAKPASAKGTYLKGVVVSTTMGPGIRLDASEVAKAVR